jgi:hypothetical protein
VTATGKTTWLPGGNVTGTTQQITYENGVPVWRWPYHTEPDHK